MAAPLSTPQVPGAATTQRPECPHTADLPATDGGLDGSASGGVQALCRWARQTHGPAGVLQGAQRSEPKTGIPSQQNYFNENERGLHTTRASQRLICEPGRESSHAVHRQQALTCADNSS